MATTDEDDLPAGALDTDHVNIRTLTEADLDAVVRIDAAATGRSRREFFRARIAATLRDSGIHLSLAAEVDKEVAGYVAVVLHYGEFGVAEPVAVLDAIGIHPANQKRKVAKALMRQLDANLRALRVTRIQTEVDWNQFDLLGFFGRSGFQPVPRLCLEKKIEVP